MQYLLTWFGTVVAYDADSAQLTQCNLAELTDATPAALLDTADAAEVTKAELQWRPPQRASRTTRAVAPRVIASVWLQRAGPRRVHLATEGGFLQVEREGALTFSATSADEQATLLALDADDLARLVHVLGSRWLRCEPGETSPPVRPTLVDGCYLVFGERWFDLADLLSPSPSDPDQPWVWPDTLTLYEGSWRLNIYNRFDPLIYYTVFGGDDYFKMLTLSLDSLQEFGSYDGAILIVTDRTTGDVIPHIPEQFHDSLHVWQTTSKDRLDHWKARYTLPSWPQATAFAPILYVDSDVIFDLPVERALIAVARADKMTAQEETFSPLVASVPSGAILFQEDRMDVEGRYGINTGIIGLPRVARFHHVLAAIRSVIDRFAAVAADRSFGDQWVANYVGVKLGCFDPSVLTPFVRITRGSGLMEPGQQPRGFVHFWGLGATARKLAGMAEYFETLRSPP